MMSRIEYLLDGLVASHMPSEKTIGKVRSEILGEESPMDAVSYQKSVDRIFKQAFWGLNHLQQFLPYAG